MDANQLEILMCAYFHEDFEGLWTSLDQYISHSSQQDLATLVSDIVAVLSTITDDRELDEYLQRLGNYAYLGEDPAAYRTWLEEIARRVAAA